MDSQQKSYTLTPEMLAAEDARRRDLIAGWDLIEDIRKHPTSPENDSSWIDAAIRRLMVGSSVGRIGV